MYSRNVWRDDWLHSGCPPQSSDVTRLARLGSNAGTKASGEEYARGHSGSPRASAAQKGGPREGSVCSQAAPAGSVPGGLPAPTAEGAVMPYLSQPTATVEWY